MAALDGSLGTIRGGFYTLGMYIGGGAVVLILIIILVVLLFR